MAERNEVVQHHQKLFQEWNKQPQNLKNIEDLLNRLKLLLTRLTFLPTAQAQPSEIPRLKQDLIVARDVLEVGALWSIATQNTESFERYTAQLKSYYFDYKDFLPESSYMYQLLGLNLLSLLSQNRVAEFHTELELLPLEQIRNNIYISRPVELEQWLMEGCYNKVFLSQGNIPSPYYNYFIEKLIHAVRVEIAACIEAAYEKVSLAEAARILFFKNIAEVQNFVKSQGLNWSVQGQSLLFSKRARESVNKIPTEHLASQAIEYAKELEMIV